MLHFYSNQLNPSMSSSPNHLPRLPLYDDFYMDNRLKGERKIINPSWNPKKGDKFLRIEIADKNDLVLLANFFNVHFTKNNNLRKSLGASFEDMEQFSFDLVEKALKKPMTWMVFDGNKLIAATLQTFYTEEEISNIFNGKLFESNPTFLVKNDYSQIINSKPYNSKANQIATIHDECFAQIGKFLPKDVKNLTFGIATGVHPNYMRLGIAEYLLNEYLKNLVNFNCNYFIAVCSALASYETLKKHGAIELFCFDYKDYKANGKLVFEHIHDGATGCHIMLFNVKEFNENNLKKSETIEPTHLQNNERSKI